MFATVDGMGRVILHFTTAMQQSETKPTHKYWYMKRRTREALAMSPPQLWRYVVLCLHGAHILSGKVLSSLVWPDLFTLQARFQLSNTHQNK